MGTYIDQIDLENALTPQTFVELFNDANTGEVNAIAVASVIDDAEGEVDARLVGFYSHPSLNQFDRLLKRAAKMFARAIAFERHPEYVRQFGTTQDVIATYEGAKALMREVQTGLARLPDQTAPATAAANSGGIVYDRGPRFCIDSADGSANGDGF